MPEQQSRGF